MLKEANICINTAQNATLIPTNNKKYIINLFGRNQRIYTELCQRFETNNYQPIQLHLKKENYDIQIEITRNDKNEITQATLIDKSLEIKVILDSLAMIAYTLNDYQNEIQFYINVKKDIFRNIKDILSNDDMQIINDIIDMTSIIYKKELTTNTKQNKYIREQIAQLPKQEKTKKKQYLQYIMEYATKLSKYMQLWNHTSTKTLTTDNILLEITL